MKIMIFDDFPFTIDEQKIIKRFAFNEEEDIESIRTLCNLAREIARPKIAMAVAYIDEISECHVKIGDTVFESRLLAENMKETEKAVPYIITCGREVYEWAGSIEGYIEKYIAEQIKIEVLGAASVYFAHYVKTNIYPEKSSSMNPGSLPDWPLGEQKKLFRLFSDAAEKIGVSLTDSCLMIPDKSVSGIVFQKESSFINCMLCNRENCPGRRADYERSSNETVKSKVSGDGILREAGK